MMRPRHDPELVCRDLIQDTAGEPAENIATTRAAEYRPEIRIGQNAIHGWLDLSHKRETKVRVCSRGVEGCGIVQLGKRERNDDQLHFIAVRTCARASAIGMS